MRRINKKMVTKGAIYSMAAMMLLGGATINAHAMETGEGSVAAIAESDQVYAGLTITKQPENIIAQVGETVTFSLETNSATAHYLWRTCKIGGDWVDVKGDANSFSMVADETMDGMCIYCEISDENGNNETSDFVCLTVRTEGQAEDEEDTDVDIFKMDGFQYVLLDGKTPEEAIANLKKAMQSEKLDTGCELTSIQFPGRYEQEGVLTLDKELVQSILNQFGLTNQDSGRRVSFVSKDMEVAFTTSAATAIGENDTYIDFDLNADSEARTLLASVYGEKLPYGVFFGTRGTEMTAGKSYGMTLRLKEYEGLFYLYRFVDGKFEIQCQTEASYVFDGAGTFVFDVQDTNTYFLTNTELDASIVSEIAYGELDEIEITQQPMDMSVTSGESVSFSVKAEGENLTYQWYKCPITSEKWTKMSSTGANTDTVTFTAKEAFDGMVVYCYIEAEDGRAVASDVAILNVAAKIRIVEQPVSQSVKSGDCVTFSVKTSNTNMTYQWQKYSDGKWVNSGSEGAKTNTLSMTAKEAFNGLKFRCKITNNAGMVVYSDTAELKVAIATKITAQPVGTNVKVGKTATFQVGAKGDGLTYQWQKYSNGRWVNCSSASAKTNCFSLVGKISFDGLKFRCKITDASGSSRYTKTVTLSVTK